MNQAIPVADNFPLREARICWEPRNISALDPEIASEKILRAVGAQVISKIHCGGQIAYLLAESSLIWSGRQIVLITCGDLIFNADSPEFNDILGPRSTEFVVRSIEDGIGIQRVVYRNGKISSVPTCSLSIVGDRDVWLERTRAEEQDKYYRGRVREFLGDDAVVDSHIFSPAGYSLNALSQSGFIALHTSLNAQGSLLSFEMSRKAETTSELSVIRIKSPVFF